MAKLNGRMNGRALSRLAVVAVAAALVGTSAAAASADGVSPAHGRLKASASTPKAKNFAAARDAAAEPGSAADPVFPMFAVDNSGGGWAYAPNGSGGLTSRAGQPDNYAYLANDALVDNNGDGFADGEWQWDKSGTLHYFTDANSADKVIGGGWNIYDKVLSPGNLGGGQGYDIIARDRAGVLWLYLGYGDGTLTSRIRVGAGWDAYTEIAGKGDLTGDGKPDIVARDKAGVLWLYKGTGNYRAPFAPRTRIGAGWNAYNKLVSTGDLNLDGRTDLIARDTSGGLWLYKGTGNAAAPYQPRVKIGWGYNIYRLMTS
ncbi:FG-GAP repeat domain-containing protein [Streptomyces sp. NPDC050485]|uniref:FG-GAP repeat domain-containing protein n=1 Tax=Streptomyces sp. NPDC050485 TaxID=3365617 RepID=UPI0037A92129